MKIVANGIRKYIKEYTFETSLTKTTKNAQYKKARYINGRTTTPLVIKRIVEANIIFFFKSCSISRFIHHTLLIKYKIKAFQVKYSIVLQYECTQIVLYF